MRLSLSETNFTHVQRNMVVRKSSTCRRASPVLESSGDRISTRAYQTTPHDEVCLEALEKDLIIKNALRKYLKPNPNIRKGFKHVPIQIIKYLTPCLLLAN